MASKKKGKGIFHRIVSGLSRVISGALAVAVCATSLFGGVDFGVFKASAAGDSRLTLTPAL